MSRRCAGSWMTNPFYALLFEHEAGIWPWVRTFYTWRISFYKANEAGEHRSVDPIRIISDGPFGTPIGAKQDMERKLAKLGYAVRLGNKDNEVLPLKRFPMVKDYASQPARWPAMGRRAPMAEACRPHHRGPVPTAPPSARGGQGRV